MHFTMKSVVAAFACSIVSAVVPLAAQAQERVIRIGVVMPISGPGSYFGVMGKEGIDLAMDQVGKNPINGVRVFELRYFDARGVVTAVPQDVRSVGVVLTTVPDGTAAAVATATVSTRIRLRNR